MSNQRLVTWGNGYEGTIVGVSGDSVVVHCTDGQVRKVPINQIGKAPKAKPKKK